jgi:hypothetical protein
MRSRLWGWPRSAVHDGWGCDEQRRAGSRSSSTKDSCRSASDPRRRGWAGSRPSPPLARCCLRLLGPFTARQTGKESSAGSATPSAPPPGRAQRAPWVLGMVIPSAWPLPPQRGAGPGVMVSEHRGGAIPGSVPDRGGGPTAGGGLIEDASNFRRASPCGWRRLAARALGLMPPRPRRSIWPLPP